MFSGHGFAQSQLQNCAEQFIGGSISNAPTLTDSPSDQPFGNNQHLCYRVKGASFFALEYEPENFAPRWAAYKLSPENYGDKGCSTYTRTTANCYIRAETWSEFLTCTESRDPFHADHLITGDRLRPADFGNSGHDNGHVAPRQAFSWHACGNYQTFSMANMSPQSALLNQDIWVKLEQQVLTWAVDHGPLYVVTGTTFGKFPHEHFQVYRDRILDPKHLYPSGSRMGDVAEQHHAHFKNTDAGHILRPKRNANPKKLQKRASNMKIPTGYFAVIYRPETGEEPAHAIAFLLPHTFENLSLLEKRIEGMAKGRSFWAFVSRIALVEQTSGVQFPGIPPEMKRGWGDEWFLKRAGSREIRAKDCGQGKPQGVRENSTRQERLTACVPVLH
ncbi:MAG: DNA/RNA non-specific endonuclease [Nitrosospira sp.]|nr:DNA/RNA non-specific endonuclease [Nitrosospira sp.]